MKRFLVLLTCCSMIACGWHLRGWEASSMLEPIRVVAKDRYAPLTLALLDALQQRGNDDSQAQLHLQLSNELLTKHTVAVTSIGSPSQYEMTLAVEFQYWRKGTTPKTLPMEVSVNRVFDFDPSNTVAKTEEENTLLDEMRRELAHRILRSAPR